MLMNAVRFVPKTTIRLSEVGSEVILLNPDMGELLRLNPVAGFIWKQLGGEVSAADIAEKVSQQFKIDRLEAERDVEKFLKELMDLEIMEVRKL